jgi:hypothetical protein
MRQRMHRQVGRSDVLVTHACIDQVSHVPTGAEFEQHGVGPSTCAKPVLVELHDAGAKGLVCRKYLEVENLDRHDISIAIDLAFSLASSEAFAGLGCKQCLRLFVPNQVTDGLCSHTEGSDTLET